MINSIKIILIVLFIAICVFLYLKKAKKLWLQVALHLGLFLALYAMLFPPIFSKNVSQNIIALADNPASKTLLRLKKDSLQIGEILNEKDFKNKYLSGKIKPQKIIIAGSTFDNETRAFLTDFEVEHLIHITKNTIQNLNYRAVLNQNQTQTVQFNVNSGSEVYAKLKFGNTTLDSVKLRKGQNSAELSFPVFGVGRNEMQINIGNSDTPIHFFSLKPSPLSILILCQIPDFEIKTLAEWLSKQGHQVKLQTDLSTNMRTELKFNDLPRNKIIDVLICTPSKINEAKAYKPESIFVMGLENGPQDIQKINSLLKTNFRIEKKGAEPLQNLANGSEVLGYTFKPNWQQVYSKNTEIIRQNNGAGTTLLQSTYPLLLSGDSTAYGKIWANFLQMYAKNNTSYSSIKAPLHLNSARPKPEVIDIANTNQKSEAKNLFTSVNWQKLNDSVEVYVDSTQTFHNQLVSYKNSYMGVNTNLSKGSLAPEQESQNPILFFLFFVAFYGSIWFINRS